VVTTRENNTRGGNDHQPPLSDTAMRNARREHSMSQFTGKVALITGGNAGIGRATAIAFAQQGATVVVSARREEEGRDVTAEINALGGKTIFVKTDVSRERDVKAMMEQTLATFGRLDCAFNNAGIEQELTPLPDQTEETYKRRTSRCTRPRTIFQT
jgi:NAD(P)-dependent dehydrogenase (short-subunit alcohol dehydrogenase family)